MTRPAKPATKAPAKKPVAKRAAKKAPVEIIAYKGFDKDLKCRGYQYEVGKTYVHTGAVKQCDSGFHVCQSPLDVLDFYGVENGNRFARVTVGGKIDRSDDKKWAASELTVSAELRLPDLIADAIRWTMAACKASKAGGSVTSGNYAKNASSGDYAKNASSGYSAKNASSGDYAKNASSGYSAKNEATGSKSVIAAAGLGSMAKGSAGVAIALPYKDLKGQIRFAHGVAGEDGIPADTWLKAERGKLVSA